MSSQAPRRGAAAVRWAACRLHQRNAHSAWTAARESQAPAVHVLTYKDGGAFSQGLCAPHRTLSPRIARQHRAAHASSAGGTHAGRKAARRAPRRRAASEICHVSCAVRWLEEQSDAPPRAQACSEHAAAWRGADIGRGARHTPRRAAAWAPQRARKGGDTSHGRGPTTLRRAAAGAPHAAAAGCDGCVVAPPRAPL
jgi:hypothetical protein